MSRKGLLHHIEINVSDLDASSAFWGWLLESFGYVLCQQWAEGRSWKKDETYIVFVQTDKKYLAHTYHRRHTGLNHLAFHADSREDVDRYTAELRHRNIKILYEDRHPHAGGEKDYAVYFEDPDRIKVEITAPVS